MAGDGARVTALIDRLERFIRAERGEDYSLRAANAIEGELATLFAGDEELEEFTDLLAQYSPGGGDYLYSESDVRPALVRCCEVLRQRLVKA
jgi:hypothetical protein